MDLISELPEPILHDVLYFLPAQDAAKTSVLSKTWKSIVSSCPSVDLRIQHYFKSTEMSFKQHVENTLQNCITKSLVLRTFKLHIFCYEPEELDDLIDRWIKFLARRSSRLEEFDIKIGRNHEAHYNLLPEGIVFAFKTLIELSLFGLGFDSSSNDCNVNLPLLRRLDLSDMDVTDAFVLKLMFSCPLLENLAIQYCDKLTSLKVSSLQRIKRIFIQRCKKLSKVEVRALSLQSFCFRGTKSMPCEIDLAGCDNLKTLCLDFYTTIDVASSLAWVQNQISKLVGLEYLVLRCPSLQTIKISNPKLKRLEIKHCKNLGATTEIDAPNINSVEYIENKLPFYSIKTSNFKKMAFKFYLGDFDTVWFSKLKELYEKIIHIGDFKVAIQSAKSDMSVITYDKLSESVLLILEELKHLKPYVIISSMSSEDWLPFLFSERCWRNMYVASSSQSSDILRVFYDEVFDKQTGEIYGRNSSTTYWNRYYDSVEIARINWIDEKDKISPLLKPHQTALYEVTHVNLKWRKQDIKNI